MKKPCEYIEIGSKSYPLRITTKGMVELETLTHKNPSKWVVSLYDSVETLAKFYRVALQTLTDISTIDEVYALFDEYIDNGGTIDDLSAKMCDVLVCAGILKAEANNLLKKQLEKSLEAQRKALTETTEN